MKVSQTEDRIHTEQSSRLNAVCFTLTAVTRHHATESAQLLSQLNAERERVKEVEGMLGKASSQMEGGLHASYDTDVLPSLEAYLSRSQP